MNDRQKILDKIKKCLRLSKSSNEHEAAAALRQAQKLMQSLGLTQDEVIAAEASASRASSGAAEKPAGWELLLANTCCAAFGCEVIFETGPWRDHFRSRKAGNWMFVGCDGRDVLCSYAFVVLIRQLRRARAAYIAAKLKRCKAANRTARADEYCIGWVAAVRYTIEAFARTDTDRQAVKAWISATGIKLKSLEVAQRKTRGDHGDSNQGFRAGADVRLDRPVGGSAPEALA